MFNHIKKAVAIGTFKTCSIILNRIKINFFEHLARTNALGEKSAITWLNFSKKCKYQNFLSLFSYMKKKRLSFVDSLVSEASSSIITKADNATQNCFSLLGCQKQHFAKIPWHYDFRLQQQNAFQDVLFNPKAFYKDILIKPGTTEKLEKDIKLPWELSRFAHLIFLGQAYQKTNDQKYVKAFTDQITDWLNENPYLLGPNWVCPMDVGLRAVNWIVGFEYFKKAEIDETFWKHFVCSLYDHMMYLENNWEIYDSITSNHYLSDLIGYFYLCWFFDGYKGIDQKTTWCYQEILKEFEKQVFDEGTDYESTTNYHVLVTEIFYHFYLLAPELGFSVSGSFAQKLKRMFNFIDWCTPTNGNLIQIGDNDSGKVVSGISLKLVNEMHHKDSSGIKHFPNFGLSILKNDKVHLSLRHHAYQAQQPTAHFHNDAGSITLAINGVDIFVDPGSYVYTPSAVWRNRFRSVTVHNTFYIEGKEPVAFDEDRLFYLDVPKNLPKIEKQGQLYTTHDLYAELGLRAHRNIEYNSERELIIHDWWKQIDDSKREITTAWNFTLNSAFDLKKIDNGWLLLYQRQEILELTSKLKFKVVDGFYSPSYGVKVDCKRLVARKKLHFERTTIQLKF